MLDDVQGPARDLPYPVWSETDAEMQRDRTSGDLIVRQHLGFLRLPFAAHLPPPRPDGLIAVPADFEFPEHTGGAWRTDALAQVFLQLSPYGWVRIRVVHAGFFEHFFDGASVSASP